MVVIGVDPGVILGIVALERRGLQTKILLRKRVVTKPKDPMVSRLVQIFDEVGAAVRNFHAEVLGYEEQSRAQVGGFERGEYQASNHKTLMTVGAVVGAARAYGARLHEVSPARVKISLLGPGSRKATKEQMLTRARIVLGPLLACEEHLADALGVALEAERLDRIAFPTSVT